MSVRYHLNRATAERAHAAHAQSSACATIHLMLATLHEQAIAEALNNGLAPIDIPKRLMVSAGGRAVGPVAAPVQSATQRMRREPRASPRFG